jgi:hypothetical protein
MAKLLKPVKGRRPDFKPSGVVIDVKAELIPSPGEQAAKALHGLSDLMRGASQAGYKESAELAQKGAAAAAAAWGKINKPIEREAFEAKHGEGTYEAAIVLRFLLGFYAGAYALMMPMQALGHLRLGQTNPAVSSSADVIHNTQILNTEAPIVIEQPDHTNPTPLYTKSSAEYIADFKEQGIRNVSAKEQIKFLMAVIFEQRPHLDETLNGQALAFAVANGIYSENTSEVRNLLKNRIEVVDVEGDSGGKTKLGFASLKNPSMYRQIERAMREGGVYTAIGVATDLYERHFWNKIEAPDLVAKGRIVNAIVWFDASLPQGVGGAKRLIADRFNPRDEIDNPADLNPIDLMLAARARYQEIATDKGPRDPHRKFYEGWLNRLQNTQNRSWNAYFNHWKKYEPSFSGTRIEIIRADNDNPSQSTRVSQAPSWDMR